MKNVFVVALMVLVLTACVSEQQEAPRVAPDVPGPAGPTAPEPKPEVVDAAPQPATAESTITGYMDYDPAVYADATSAGQLVFLEFYAAWCPYCRALEPIIKESFSELQREKVDVIGFRVNYDSQTDLKRTFNVRYQHTHLLLRDGNVVWRSLDSTLTKEDLKATILKYS